MTAPGTRQFTHALIGVETTYGTPVATTYQLYVDGSGMWDEDAKLNFHDKENRGVRADISRAPTQTSEDVTFKLTSTAGCAYDWLVIAFSMLAGGATAVGATADRTWTQTPAMTGSNSPKSYSLDLGDDIQNWRLQGAQFQTIKLSSARGDLTSIELTGFAQRAVKTTASAPAANAAIKIAGDLWTIKFASAIASLTGTTASSNFLLDWDLTIDTGLRPRHYMDGNLYIAQSVEAAAITAMLNLTVESTALAVSEFYDKYKAQTLDFIRLKNIGPVLGSSFYSSQIDLPVYYDKPSVISGEEDGINLYKVPAKGTYDSTSAKQVQIVTVSSLTALP